jgi:CheY-like chemotaxis protein
MSARILVVDDSLTIRRALEMILEPAGYDLRLAESGKEALEIAHAFDPELILLDYVLPDMRGPDVCAALEEIPRTQTTPVVLVSAKGTSIRKAYEDARNVVSYITKPFKPQVILSVVAHALAENRRAPETKDLAPPRATAAPPRGGLQSVESGFRNLLSSLEDAASLASRRDLDADSATIDRLLDQAAAAVEALRAERGERRWGTHLNTHGEIVDPGAEFFAAHAELCQASLLLARRRGAELEIPVTPSRLLVSTSAPDTAQRLLREIPAGEKNRWILLDQHFALLPHLAALLRPEMIVLEGPPDESRSEALKRVSADTRICCLDADENRDALDAERPAPESLDTLPVDLGASVSAQENPRIEVVEL